MRRRARLTGLLLPLLALVPAVARGQGSAALVPLGAPEFQQGLRITAGYLSPPPTLEPPGPAPNGAVTIHLQVEVDAVRGNPYGFEAEDSIPYLQVPFVLVHDATGRRQEGTLAPMVSREGFHYGATVALPAPGPYRLTVEIRPPAGLGRHVDPRTGVAPWWPPFAVTWPFRYPAE